jgi:translation initiation factor IF-3
MKQAKVNERITAHRVILISSDGRNLGEMLRTSALDIAKKDGFDLVEVSSGTIPTCKIVDYGKMLYEKSKQERHQHHAPVLKEIRFTYNTDPHDIDIKKRKITEFLSKGHSVLVAMKVRGRERYVNRGAAKERFTSLVKEFSPALRPGDISENEEGYSMTLRPASK